MKVKYFGPWADYSGYGEANRNAIRALTSAGVQVTAQRITHTRETADYGRAYQEISLLEGRKLDYNIKVIHITPDGYMKYLEPMKYHIGHLFWETDGLTPSWVWNANLMDEIWTGDEFHVEVFKKSGVRCPVIAIPQAVETDIPIPKPFKIKQRPEFLFYSIFQWIERKNPMALLEAFWREFKDYKDVGLLIKTYRMDFSAPEKEQIYRDIKEWKYKYGIGAFPRVLVFDELLSREDMFRFHATGDCFVLPHRGEGWGIPQVEACLMQKPVISTNLGGMHEWMAKDTFIPLNDFKMVNVFNMEYVPWYTTDQKWANPSVHELRQAMREVYENRDKAKKMAVNARKHVLDIFNYKRVGEMMKKRLETIEKEIL